MVPNRHTESPSPLGCCRESSMTPGFTSNDEYTPVQDELKLAPRQLHRWNTKYSVMSLAASDDVIYAGCESGDILIFDINTYEERARLTGHEGSVYTLVLLPDRRYLFSGASDSLVKVWDLKTLQEVYTIYSVYDIGDIFSAAWVPSQETLYFGTQNASIQWLKLHESSSARNDPNQLPSRRFDKFFDSRGPGGKLFPQQNALKTLPDGDETISLLEVPQANSKAYAHFGYVYCMVVTKIGNTEVLISGGGDGTVKVWDCDSSSLELRHTFDTEEDGVLSMACGDDGFLYCGLASGRVMMFDLDTMQMIRVDAAPGRDKVMSLTVKGDCVFRGARDFVSKWDPRQYNRGQWPTHSGLTLALVTTNNGKLISGGNDASVAMWDISGIQKSRVQEPCSTVAILDNENMIKTLSTFVAYKSVSGFKHGEYLRDGRRCASFLRSLLQHFGAEAELIPVDNGNPIVHGVFKSNNPDKARILFYGHYDVIIANESDKWHTNPWEMTAMDGYMYGRGVSDNKGPIVAAVYAAAEQMQSGELKNDIVFLIEGEEESGSKGFQEVVSAKKEFIGNIDWVLLSNSYWLDDNVPCLNYGLRGIINTSIEIKSGKPDLHSGVHGGCFREPTMDMVTLLSKLGQDEGKVLVPGFYDSVRELSASEEKLYDAIVATPGFEGQKDLLMKKWRYPSMTIHRISVSGPGNSTVIPASATATISFRIVPDQDIETIKNALKTYVHKIFGQLHTTNSYSLNFERGSDPWIGDPDCAAFQILRTALRQEWQIKDPLFIREGGSIPVVRFLEKNFDAKAAQLPCGQSSDGAHLDNERLRVTNFFKTRNVLAHTFSKLQKCRNQ